jgi:hypothetical protein
LSRHGAKTYFRASWRFKSAQSQRNESGKMARRAHHRVRLRRPPKRHGHLAAMNQVVEDDRTWKGPTSST